MNQLLEERNKNYEKEIAFLKQEKENLIKQEKENLMKQEKENNQNNEQVILSPIDFEIVKQRQDIIAKLEQMKNISLGNAVCYNNTRQYRLEVCRDYLSRKNSNIFFVIFFVFVLYYFLFFFSFFLFNAVCYNNTRQYRLEVFFYLK